MICIKSKKLVMNIPDPLSGNMEMDGYSSGVWSVRVRSYRSWVWFFRYAVQKTDEKHCTKCHVPGIYVGTSPLKLEKVKYQIWTLRLCLS